MPVGGAVRDRQAADRVSWRGNCESGACVEIAVHGEAVMVRSSVAPEEIVTLTRAEWREFLDQARTGLLDDL